MMTLITTTATPAADTLRLDGCTRLQACQLWERLASLSQKDFAAYAWPYPPLRCTKRAENARWDSCLQRCW